MYKPDTDNKGYKAASKLIMKLRGEVYPKMTDEELEEFKRSMIDHLDGIIPDYLKK
jgi:hypothetical protein